VRARWLTIGVTVVTRRAVPAFVTTVCFTEGHLR
jgi:hypothetical protein